MLVMALAMLAGLPRDRFMDVPATDGFVVTVASSPSPAIDIVTAAMAEPDDGLDDAAPVTVPMHAATRPVALIDGLIAVLAERSASLLHERPPRNVI